MTVADVVGQIGEIRARLAQLVPPTTTADSGASFASALSGATTSTGTTGTTGAATTGTATDGALTTGTGVTGDDVVKAAKQYEGVPYVLGGESKSGIDCSGLVQASFKDLGVSVPRLVHEQQTIGQKVDSLKDAKPGDLIVLNGGDHIAIWAGNGTAIHAPYPGRSVSVQKAWFDDSDIVTIRRVVPATDDAAATSGTASPVQGVTATSGASTAATSQAAAMLAMYGGTSSTDASSTGSSDSMAALMASIGGTASGSTTSGSTAQQLLAARASLLGTGA